MKKENTTVVYLLFAFYNILMLWLLFGQRMHAFSIAVWDENYWNEFIQKINLIPFHTILEFLKNRHMGGKMTAIINLAGNVVMFIPLGFFTTCVCRGAKTFWRSMRRSCVTIVCIEIIQLITLLGSLDIDDLLLNMIGAAIGYCLYRSYPHRNQFRKEKLYVRKTK